MASLGENTAIIITEKIQELRAVHTNGPYKRVHKMQTCFTLTVVVGNEKTIALYLRIIKHWVTFFNWLDIFSFPSKNLVQFLYILLSCDCFFKIPGPVCLMTHLKRRAWGRWEEGRKLQSPPLPKNLGEMTESLLKVHFNFQLTLDSNSTKIF